jgi:hypothetical protein
VAPFYPFARACLHHMVIQDLTIYAIRGDSSAFPNHGTLIFCAAVSGVIKVDVLNSYNTDRGDTTFSLVRSLWTMVFYTGVAKAESRIRATRRKFSGLLTVRL